jgi:predicted acyl esterase
MPYLTLEEDAYVTPDTPVQLDVPLQPTAWRLLAGHTLQLQVATNAGEKCSPTGLFAPPVGCAFSIPTAQSLAGGVYTILDDAEHVSVVNVPLVTSDDITTARSATTPTSGDAELPLDWGS